MPEPDPHAPDDDPTIVGPSRPTFTEPAPRGGARGGGLRASVAWTLGLGVTLGLAIVAGLAGGMLAVFGLGGVALLIAVTLVAAGATVWRRGMLPLAVLATALTLPAAGVALSQARFARSIGTLTVTPSTVDDVAGKTFRRGAGSVFLDLRKLRPEQGTVTRIRAQADNGRVVIALPRGTCLDTRVRYRPEPYASDILTQAAVEGAGLGLQLAGLDGGDSSDSGSSNLTLQARGAQFENESSTVSRDTYGLLGFGRLGEARLDATEEIADWHRPVDRPGAARLEFDVRSRDQIVIRDYPDTAGPMIDEFTLGDPTQVAGQRWPTGLQAPRSPGDLRKAHASTARTAENRSRWVTWERRMVRWAREQAQRAAGSCATQEQLRERAYTFLIQPERVRGTNPLLTRARERSAIKQPVAPTPGSQLVVEVDGIGGTRVLGVDRPGHPFQDADGYGLDEESVNG